MNFVHISSRVQHALWVCSWVALLALGLPAQAWAGKITVTGMKPGSQAAIQTFGSDGKIISTITINDTNRDGKATVEVTQQDKIARIVIFKLDAQGVRQIDRRKFVSGTLPSLEPFDLPNFGPVNPASALYIGTDANTFLALANPFTPGQVLSVTNGAASQTAAITFHDASGLVFPLPDPLDPALLDALPLFTGSVVVAAPSNYAPVPELPSRVLALAGFVALLALRHRRHQRSGAMWSAQS